MSKRNDALSDGREHPYFRTENAAFTLLPIIGAPAFAVYSCLLFHAGKGDTAYPSYTTISRETGLARATVAASLRVLIEHGLIDVERRKNSCLYTILPLQQTQPVQEMNQFSSRTSSGDEPTSSAGELVTSSAGELKQDVVKQDSKNKMRVLPSSGRKRDLGWESLVRFCGYEPRDKSGRALFNKMLNEIRAEFDATDDDIELACSNYILEWPEMERSPTALRKHFQRMLNVKKRSALSHEYRGEDWTGAARKAGSR